MQVIKNGFSILKENEKQFFLQLEKSIEQIDELSTMEINRFPNSYNFRIACSSSKYIQPLLKQLLDFHTNLGIKLDVSKSIRNSFTINFEIKI